MGNALLENVKSWRHKDTMQVAGLVKAEYDYLAPHDRPRQIVVDSIGLGAGVADRLRKARSATEDATIGWPDDSRNKGHVAAPTHPAG